MAVPLAFFSLLYIAGVVALRGRHRALTACAMLGIAALVAGCDSSDSSSSNSTTTEQHAVARPTAKPKSRAELKHEFLQTVNEDISGPMIVAAPFKYVGKHVDLHCTVSDVPLEDAINANCGVDEDGDPTNLVIQTDSRQLTKGQSIRVIGTVVEPVEGNNANGGDMRFPTVKAEFME